MKRKIVFLYYIPCLIILVVTLFISYYKGGYYPNGRYFVYAYTQENDKFLYSSVAATGEGKFKIINAGIEIAALKSPWRAFGSQDIWWGKRDLHNLEFMEGRIGAGFGPCNRPLEITLEIPDITIRQPTWVEGYFEIMCTTPERIKNSYFYLNGLKYLKTKTLKITIYPSKGNTDR